MVFKKWIYALVRSMRGLPLMAWHWLVAPFRFKTLFKGFVSQEIRGRYAGSIGGLAWSVLTPLANLLIYIFVFSVIFQIRLKPIETGTDSFVVYLLVGLLPWIAFSEALGSSPGIILNKANLITKVAFPFEILPVAEVVVTFILNGLGFMLLIGYLVIKGYFHWMWLYLPLVVMTQVLFTLGLVILIAGLSVFVRDIRQFIGVVLQLWMYLTPILYPVSMVPEKFMGIFKLNPMYPFIELYHQILLQHTISWGLVAYATALAVFFFLSGVAFFGRARHAFADVL